MSNRSTPSQYRKTVSRDNVNNRMTSNVVVNKEKPVTTSEIKGALLGVKKLLGYKDDNFNSRLKSKVPELESLKNDLVNETPEDSDLDNQVPPSPSPPPLSPVKVKVVPLNEPIYSLVIPENSKAEK